MRYEFISKTLFFPEEGILVVGDLHLGYEFSLIQSGILIPERQIQDLINDLKEIFRGIRERDYELKKIIFIGDIKHSFSFQASELREFERVIEFLGEILPRENIIFIKGNHDTVDYTFESVMKGFYIEGETAFMHGDMSFPEVFEKKIKIIVMGHIHPSVVLSEKPGIKRETYKCFLEGEHYGKKIIILPSFLDFSEGSPVNNYSEDYEDFFSIIPKKALLNFKVRVIGEDGVYEFGSIKTLINR